MKFTKPYNVYYGTIGKTLGIRYRHTKNFKSEEDALNYAKNAATSFYYKNEGKYGIPSYSDIVKEAKLSGVDVQTLYEDHIVDMMRWYAIPTELDSITKKQLRW